MPYQIELEATPEQINEIKAAYQIRSLREIPARNTLLVNLKDVYVPGFERDEARVAVAAAEVYDDSRPVKYVIAHVNGVPLGAWDVTGEDWVPIDPEDRPVRVDFHPRHRVSLTV